MSAPTPDLPAVTLTDEERQMLGGVASLAGYRSLLDQMCERVERIVAARLAAQPVAPAPDRDALPRVVECPSAEALFDLLASLNEAGLHPEVACQPAAPFIALLKDADYAGAVHYVATDPDGEVHCCACDDCHGAHDAPRFPLTVVLAHDPEPASILSGEVTAWWRAARPAPSGDADLAARVQALDGEWTTEADRLTRQPVTRDQAEVLYRVVAALQEALRA